MFVYSLVGVQLYQHRPQHVHRQRVRPFYYIAANNTVFSLRATASPHTATLTGGALALAPPPRLARVVKRAQFTGCCSSQQAALNAADLAAQNYTAGALAYIVHNTINSSASRYTTWFGAPTDERYGIVCHHQ